MVELGRSFDSNSLLIKAESVKASSTVHNEFDKTGLFCYFGIVSKHPVTKYRKQAALCYELFFE